MSRTKIEFLIFTFFMSLCMSGAMSLSMLLIDFGVLDFKYLEWIRKWALSTLVAYPVSILASPLIKLIVAPIAGRD